MSFSKRIVHKDDTSLLKTSRSDDNKKKDEAAAQSSKIRNRIIIVLIVAVLTSIVLFVLHRIRTGAKRMRLTAICDHAGSGFNMVGDNLPCFLKKDDAYRRNISSSPAADGDILVLPSANMPPEVLITDDIAVTMVKNDGGYSWKPCAPERCTSGYYDMIGIDLATIKQGDVLLSSTIKTDDDKDMMLRVMAHHFPKEKFQKTWKDRSRIGNILFRMTRVDYAVQYCIGGRLPSHVAIIGEMPDDASERTVDNIIILDYIVPLGKRRLTLRQYLDANPSTKTRMILVRHSGPQVNNHIVSASYDAAQARHVFKAFGEHLSSSGPVAYFGDRSKLFSAMNMLWKRGLCERYKDVVDESLQGAYQRHWRNIIMAPERSRYVDEIIKAMMKPTLEARGDEDVGDKEYVCSIVHSPLLFRASSLNPLFDSGLSKNSEDSMATMRLWNGLTNEGGFSCAGVGYALLESWGIVIGIAPTPYVMDATIGGNGGVKSYRISFRDHAICVSLSEIRDSVNYSGQDQNDSRRCNDIRISAPQHVTPSDYIRRDFQWAEGVHITYASPIVYQKRVEK